MYSSRFMCKRHLSHNSIGVCHLCLEKRLHDVIIERGEASTFTLEEESHLLVSEEFAFNNKSRLSSGHPKKSQGDVREDALDHFNNDLHHPHSPNNSKMEHHHQHSLNTAKKEITHRQHSSNTSKKEPRHRSSPTNSKKEPRHRHSINDPKKEPHNNFPPNISNNVSYIDHYENSEMSNVNWASWLSSLIPLKKRRSFSKGKNQMENHMTSPRGLASKSTSVIEFTRRDPYYNSPHLTSEIGGKNPSNHNSPTNIFTSARGNSNPNYNNHSSSKSISKRRSSGSNDKYMASQKLAMLNQSKPKQWQKGTKTRDARDDELGHVREALLSSRLHVEVAERRDIIRYRMSKDAKLNSVKLVEQYMNEQEQDVDVLINALICKGLRLDYKRMHMDKEGFGRGPSMVRLKHHIICETQSSNININNNDDNNNNNSYYSLATQHDLIYHTPPSR